MNCLFVYGTLTSSLRQREILGRVVQSETAFLDGWTLIPTPPSFGRYPIAVSCKGKTVAGLLLFGLSEKELSTLDAYEEVGNGPYSRCTVVVRLANGRKLQVFTYAKMRPT